MNKEMNKNNQKNVEYIIPNSFLSSLFSTINLTTELLIPKVEIDFAIDVKFLKLPINAIPDAPRKTEIIFEEITPKTKLIATEIEFSDKTFKSLFCFNDFKL